MIMESTGASWNTIPVGITLLPARGGLFS
jgi:hypothetical protein